MGGGKFKRKLSEVNTTKLTSDAICVMCSLTFILFWLRKTVVIVKIFRFSFRMFACLFPTVISSIFDKSFPFPFPYFVLFILWYLPFHVVYMFPCILEWKWKCVLFAARVVLLSEHPSVHLPGTTPGRIHLVELGSGVCTIMDPYVSLSGWSSLYHHLCWHFVKSSRSQSTTKADFLQQRSWIHFPCYTYTNISGKLFFNTEFIYRF